MIVSGIDKLGAKQIFKIGINAVIESRRHKLFASGDTVEELGFKEFNSSFQRERRAAGNPANIAVLIREGQVGGNFCQFLQYVSHNLILWSLFNLIRLLGSQCTLRQRNISVVLI